MKGFILAFRTHPKKNGRALKRKKKGKKLHVFQDASTLIAAIQGYWGERREFLTFLLPRNILAKKKGGRPSSISSSTPSNSGKRKRYISIIWLRPWKKEKGSPP